MMRTAAAIGERAVTLAAPGMEPIELPLASEPADRKIVDARGHCRPAAGQLVGAELD